ncbi:MAG: leucine-rich repeat protein [Paludibacteraceae bacterium]|nr:leucine-rich repeat protein [Paludibacteraceae bacterium]
MKKLTILFAALTLSAGLWAANSVITFTSTKKLYSGDIYELIYDYEMGDGAKWEAFKAQYSEFAYMDDPSELKKMGFGFFNPNCFLDANGQVLNYTYNYDESTHAGTITFAGELVTMYGDEGTGWAFYECTALTSITLPEGLTSIGRNSFVSCSLASVTLPEGLTTIGDQAFQNCKSLTSITIPANVTEIGYGAFIDCSGLTDFYVAWTTTLPTIGSNLFLDASIGTATLHVPAGSLALYQNDDQWKYFGTFVEYNPLPNIKTDAIAEINAAIDGVTDEAILAIATTAITNINNATTEAGVNSIKTQALADIDLAKYKAAAITEITNARQGIQNENLNNWIDGAINDIQKGGPDATPGIDEIKEEVLNLINFFKEGKAEGIEEGKAEAKAALPTDPEGTTGHTVTITKGDKTLILVNPDKVTYGKQE